MAQWVAGDESRNAQGIYNHRKAMLDGLRDFYQKKGWSAGPHLFIDDRYIWLFSPMKDFGIHATFGNSFNSNNGALHYSIGIEVVGDYTNHQWPDSSAKLVGHAVAALKASLNTFELKPLYPTVADRAGAKQVQDRNGELVWVPIHPEKLRWGAVSGHRDYNKPQCPGDSVTDAFYLQVLADGWTSFNGGLTIKAQPPYSPGTYVVQVDGAHIWQAPKRSVVAFDLGRGSNFELDSFQEGEPIDGNAWWGHLKDGRGFVSMTIVQ